MINIFKRTVEKPATKHSPLLQQTVNTFKGVYKKITDIVHTAGNTAPLLPYVPKQEVRAQKQAPEVEKKDTSHGGFFRSARNLYTKTVATVQRANNLPTLIPYTPSIEMAATTVSQESAKPTIKKIATETHTAITETLKTIAKNEEKRKYQESYHRITKLSSDVESSLYQAKKNDLSPQRQEMFTGIAVQMQKKLHSHLSEKLPLEDMMNKTQVELTLSRSGYIRYKRGMTGYAALHHSLEEEDKQYVDKDGSIWVHHTVASTAESTQNTDAILHTSWDRIEEGIIPVFHVDRLMYLLGYTEVPERQTYHSFTTPSSRSESNLALA